MATEFSRGKAAQAWCTPKTEKIVMDTDLAEAFADILDEIWGQPGLAMLLLANSLMKLSHRIGLRRD